MFKDNTHVTLDIVQSKSFPLCSLFCRIDWCNGHNPLPVTGEIAYVPDDFITEAFIEKPDWMKRGLQETDSGYGNKLTTQYKVKCINGKTYRVYCRCYSNSGTLYILIGGYEKIVHDFILGDKLKSEA